MFISRLTLVSSLFLASSASAQFAGLSIGCEGAIVTDLAATGFGACFDVGGILKSSIASPSVRSFLAYVPRFVEQVLRFDTQVLTSFFRGRTNRWLARRTVQPDVRVGRFDERVFLPPSLLRGRYRFEQDDRSTGLALVVSLTTQGMPDLMPPLVVLDHLGRYLERLH